MVTASLTAPAPGLAGHQAGAAVDARLKFAGQPEKFYELGNEYAEGDVIASIDSPYITARQWETRMYFAAAMRMGGFKLLRTENWHGSHGDRGMGADGAVHMGSARFGPLQSFERTTGRVQPYEPGWVEGWYLGAEERSALLAAARQQTSDGYAHTVAGLAGLFLEEMPEHHRNADAQSSLDSRG